MAPFSEEVLKKTGERGGIKINMINTVAKIDSNILVLFHFFLLSFFVFDFTFYYSCILCHISVGVNVKVSYILKTWMVLRKKFC